MLGTQLDARAYLETCSRLLRRIDCGQLERLPEDVAEACRNGRTVFVCGCGTSGTVAQEFCDGLNSALSQTARSDKRAAHAVCLTDRTAALFADPEQNGSDNVLREILREAAVADDFLIGLDVAGSTASIIRALRWAADRGLTTWGLTGHPGGKLQGAAHRHLKVPMADEGAVIAIHRLLLSWIHDAVTVRLVRAGSRREERVAARL